MRALALTLVLVPVLAYAGATKCRDASGKVFITDSLCPSGSRVERVQNREFIPEERLISAQQMRETNRMKANAIDREREMAQAEALQRATAFEQREEEERLVKDGQDLERKKTEECIRLAKRGRNARHEAMAIGCEWGFESERQASREHAIQREQQMQRDQQNQQPKIITSCDSGGCWDNTGNRYNNAGKGTTFRQDGKFCRTVGNQFRCD